jgi:lysozyme
MNEDRKLTAAGANLIKHFEGCMEKSGDHYRAYKCPANVLTIGWGHTGHHGKKFDAASRWTLQECHDAFLEDMGTFERAVRRLVKVPLTAYQYDALVSFCYNCGEGNLAKSTLLKKVNAGDFGSWSEDKGGTGAAAEFPKWNKGGGKVLPGLVRRRASEALLFQNIPDENYDGKPDKVIKPPPHPMPQAVDQPGDQA